MKLKMKQEKMGGSGISCRVVFEAESSEGEVG